MTNGRARKGDVLVLVGTRKGAFILSSDPGRGHWSLSGPHFAGSDVYHLAYDPRGEDTVFAAVNHPVWGPDIHRSRDLGRTWERSKTGPRFKAKGQSVNRVWHVEPGRVSEPGVVYAGVEPAALFRSDDGGATWAEVVSLSKHPTRPRWQPGFGGLCLHSMVLDPTSAKRMWVGISAVGVMGTENAGTSWRPMNKGVRADFAPDKFPEFGQCVHKLLSPKSKPKVLYQQNHCGVYRSDDGGEAWKDLSEGLPSRFGFVLGLDAADPKTIYVLPEDQATTENVGGGQRYVSEGKFRVFRSKNGGEDWEALTRGLPQRNAYLHSMREGMATDSLDPSGVYVGTTTGQVFHSRDGGDTWSTLIDNLPPILSVSSGRVA
jgi:photosystem II stability/assembly factor-like uncharacterized protein